MPSFWVSSHSAAVAATVGIANMFLLVLTRVRAYPCLSCPTFCCSVVGGTFLILASAGTGVYTRSGFLAVLLILVGIATVWVSSVGTYLADGDYFLIDLTKESSLVNDAGYIICLIVGCSVMVFHLKKLIFILTPKKVTAKIASRISGVGALLIPGMGKAELATKKAADFKIATMIDNSLRMHGVGAGAASSSRPITRSSTRGSHTSSTGGSFGVALLHFQASADEREVVGGIPWAFKKMWNGTIFHEEGVWIHARLIASNMSQVFVAVFFVFLLIGVALSTERRWNTGVFDDDAVGGTTDDFFTSNPNDDFSSSNNTDDFITNNPTDDSFTNNNTDDFFTNNPTDDLYANITDPEVLGTLTWAPGNLEFLAAKPDNFSDIFWNFDLNLSARLTTRILNSVTDPVIEQIVKGTNSSTVRYFCDVAQTYVAPTVQNRRLEDGGGGLFDLKLWQLSNLICASCGD